VGALAVDDGEDALDLEIDDPVAHLDRPAAHLSRGHCRSTTTIARRRCVVGAFLAK
jgi:hypothetical protein